MFTLNARQVISGWNWKRENDVVLNTLNHRMNVSIRTICFCVWFKRINSSCEVVRINYKVTQKENIYFLYLLFIFFFFRVKCIVLFIFCNHCCTLFYISLQYVSQQREHPNLQKRHFHSCCVQDMKYAYKYIKRDTVQANFIWIIVCFM